MKTQPTEAAFFNQRISGLVPYPLSLLLAVAQLGIAVTGTLAASPAPDAQNTHHQYKLIDLGTFGGPSSYVIIDSQVLNNRGAFVGWADTPMPDPYSDSCFNLDCFVSHAFRWQDGIRIDLGTLPGGSSSQAVWIAANGLIVGNSQNGEIDSLIPGFPERHGVLWRNGQVNDLGTFGGNESMAAAVNSHGQAVGSAVNTIADPYSLIDFLFYGSSNGTQARAFLWQDGQKQDLGTLAAGNDALAFFVNEAGQVAGFSYTNSTPNSTTGLPTFHPFLWEKGKGMQDLGSFGGTAVVQMGGLTQRGEVVGSLTLPGDATWHPFLWNGQELIDLGTFGGGIGYGNWVNNNGEVVGQASYPGDRIFHAFLWKNGTLSDLGLLPGDRYSEPEDINSKSQIVGVSGDSVSSRAVLWEKGQIFDLNTVIGPGSSLQLAIALEINDRGEITASAVRPNGDQHAVLLVPCDENHPGLDGCDYSLVETPAAVVQPIPAIRDAASRTLPPSLQRRMSRYHFPYRADGPKN